MKRTFAVWVILIAASMTTVDAVADGTQTTNSKKLIVDFEKIKPYTGQAAIWPGNPRLEDSVRVSSVPGIHGNAVQFIYNYQGDEVCHYGGFHSWMYTVADFDQPKDLSKCDGFSYMIRNTKPADDMAISFYLRDTHNHWMRIMDSGVLQTPRKEWQERTCALAQAPKEIDNPYGHGLQADMWFSDGSNIDLAHIDKIAVNFLDAGIVKNCGAFTVELDDFCILEGTDNRKLIKSFNLTTSDTLAQWTGVRGTTVTQGLRGLELETTISRWVLKGAEHTFDNTIDLTNMAYVKVQVSGDPALAKFDTTFDIILTDTEEKMINCVMYGLLDKDEFHTGFAPTQAASFLDKDFYGRSCWRLGTYVGNYDQNKDFNFAEVKRILIGYNPQNICDEGRTAKITVHKIDFCGTAATPQPTHTVSPPPATAKP